MAIGWFQSVSPVPDLTWKKPEFLSSGGFPRGGAKLPSLLVCDQESSFYLEFIFKTSIVKARVGLLCLTGPVVVVVVLNKRNHLFSFVGR